MTAVGSDEASGEDDDLANIEAVMSSAMTSQRDRAKAKAKERAQLKKAEQAALVAAAAATPVATTLPPSKHRRIRGKTPPSVSAVPTVAAAKAKPASAAVASGGDEMPQLAGHDLGTILLNTEHPTFSKGKNDFTSSCYRRIRTLAKTQMPEADAVALAKAAYKYAGLVWDSHH
jgi:hypothetical protein